MVVFIACFSSCLLLLYPCLDFSFTFWGYWVRKLLRILDFIDEWACVHHVTIITLGVRQGRVLDELMVVPGGPKVPNKKLYFLSNFCKLFSKNPTFSPCRAIKEPFLQSVICCKKCIRHVTCMTITKVVYFLNIEHLK